MPRIAVLAVLLLSTAASAAAQATTTPAAPKLLTPAQARAALRNPAHPAWRAKAPDTVHFDVTTSKGAFVVELIREWAPAGVDRFFNLARTGYFDDSRFFRVIPFFVAQFGIAGDPRVATLWGSRRLPVDSVRGTNARGTLSYAQYAPDRRTTNVFVNLRDNTSLDSLGFAPIGRVIEGMEVVDSLYSGYGERPAAAAPIGDPRRLYGESNRYLDAVFPLLDRIVTVAVRPPRPPVVP